MSPVATVTILLFSIALLCVHQVECDVAFRETDLAHEAASERGSNSILADSSEAAAVEVDAKMAALVDQLLARNQTDLPKRNEMIEATKDKVNLVKVFHRIEQSLPTDVAGLVETRVTGKAESGQTPTFSEASLKKALNVLNNLVEKGWAELDDKLIECKEFEDKNRGTFDQVMTDIARLGEQIADADRIRAESAEQIVAKDKEIWGTISMIRTEYQIYIKIYLAQSREMTIRKNDMAVFQFLMVVSACPASLLQVGPGRLKQTTETQGPQICEDGAGRFSMVAKLGSEDRTMAAKLMAAMTPAARTELHELLAAFVPMGLEAPGVSLIEEAAVSHAERNATKQGKDEKAEKDGDHDDDDDDDDDDDNDEEDKEGNVHNVDKELADDKDPDVKEADKILEQTSHGERSLLQDSAGAPAAATTTASPVKKKPMAKKTKVKKRVNKRKGGFKCTKQVPDCGLLHDKMSLLWGKYKDQVDSLQKVMDRNQDKWELLRSNLNQQLEVLRNSKARFNQQLNEAIANMNADKEESSEKEDERRELEGEYKKFMKSCRKRIEWIMFQDVCAYIGLRATVMKTSKTCPPAKIVDCQWTNWIPSKCTKSCDNKCPHPTDPYGCGGVQTLWRNYITRNNACGYQCPSQSKRRKCNQFKCPVDCKMSRWSSFSKCSKDCEGGAQSRTRSILVQPKNGGASCNTVQETRPCNTGSCDRNCRLSGWTSWSPCSVACNGLRGGFQIKYRRVVIPIRGKGRCPKSSSKLRRRYKKCNTHKCMGDEMCIAKQDLVLALDGSGSLRESGWKIVKAFAMKLVEKYQGQFFGAEAMKIGLVQFGNGKILADGTISDAILAQQLSTDMAAVKTKIDGLTYQKGFTNMAQSFGVAEKVLLLGGRKSAQSAVLTITDGKPSFLVETWDKVRQLRDKHVKIFMAPITQYRGKEFNVMKLWASSPWWTNVVRIPGIDPLGADPGVFAQRMLVKFCPYAVSKSELAQQEKDRGFMLVREKGFCGGVARFLSRSARRVQDCASLAQQNKYSSFIIGSRRYTRGRCYAMSLAVDQAKFDAFKANRGNPACPAGSWKRTPLYDFYVLQPISDSR